MISAASSSSRMAIQARPTRLRSRFPTSSSTRTMIVQISQYQGVPLVTAKIGLPLA